MSDNESTEEAPASVEEEESDDIVEKGVELAKKELLNLVLEQWERSWERDEDHQNYIEVQVPKAVLRKIEEEHNEQESEE